MTEDDSDEDQPVYATIIEYKSIDKEQKVVQLFGSWDRFIGHTELEYQGKQIFAVVAFIPAGIHHLRFLINGKKWDTNFFCNNIVVNGIKYNLIEVKPNNNQTEIDNNKIQKILYNKYETLNYKLNQQKWNKYTLFSKQM
eukprot:452185_1